MNIQLYDTYCRSKTSKAVGVTAALVFISLLLVCAGLVNFRQAWVYGALLLSAGSALLLRALPENRFSGAVGRIQRER